MRPLRIVARAAARRCGQERQLAGISQTGPQKRSHPARSPTAEPASAMFSFGSQFASGTVEHQRGPFQEKMKATGCPSRLLGTGGSTK